MAYTTVAGVRSLSAGDDVSDPARFSDTVVTNAIAVAEALIDDVTGTSFEAKTFDSTTTGTGTTSTLLTNSATNRQIVHPISITAVTIDGSALLASQWAAWVLDPAGIIYRDSGTFPAGATPRNINIVGTAGRTTAAPLEIKQACELITRDYLLSLHDRTSTRALQTSDEFGTTVYAQPGKHGPTTMPVVNQILRRYSALTPGIA